MKTRIALLSLLIAPLAMAADAAPSAPKPPAVLALAPADALVIIYLPKPAAIFDHPIWEALLANPTADIPELLRTSAAAFNGPTMIAVSGSPLNPLSLRVEFAAQPQDGAESFFTQLSDAALPAIAKAAGTTSARVEETAGLRTIRVPAPIPLGLFAAEKQGIVYGSSNPAAVNAWRDGKDLPSRFADGDDAGKLPAAALQSADALVYVNARGLIPHAAQHLDRLSPTLYSSLGLDRIEFAALTAEWSRGKSVFDLTIGVAEGEGGLAELLAPRNSPVEIASLVPADWTFFVRGAMQSAADFVNSINDLLGDIDPAIVAEFRQECADFKSDYGFDPIEDLAANLVDEWVVAGQPFEAGSPLIVAARLVDAAKFQRQADALVRAFNLTVEQTTSGGAVIHSAAKGASVELSWATVGNYVVISRKAETIAQAIAAQAGDRNMLLSAAMQDVQRKLPAENARFGLLRLTPLARFGLHEQCSGPAKAEMSALLQKLIDADATLGVSVSRGEGTLSLRAALSDSATNQVREVAWKSLAESAKNARAQSQRMVSAANVRGIATACLIYANDHKGEWPASFVDLIQAGDVTPGIFWSPMDGPTGEISVQNVNRDASYAYRPGTGLPPEEVVLCERELHDGGANFGFVDGHVEWITGERAERLLATVARGR